MKTTIYLIKSDKNITIPGRSLLLFISGIFLFLLFPSTSKAQFYTGSNMTFGKSRIQFENRFWMFYRYEKFETFFYQGGKTLAIYTARFADKKIKEIEKEIDYSNDKNIQFVIFNNLADLKQSNIGLSSEENYNIGGVAHIVGTKIILYFNGNYKNFEQQITAGLASVILNKMLYGNKMFSVFKNSAMLSLPEWFVKGYISYIASPWSTEMDNIVKNGIRSGKYKKFNRLEGADAVYAGHSIWRFVADKYGKAVIPNIIYLTKVSKNIESGFIYILNRNLKQIMKEWQDFYIYDYSVYDKTRIAPDSTGLITDLKKKRIYNQMKVCPDSSLFAYVSYNIGRYKVKIQNATSGKRKRILRGGYKIDEKVDYSYPLIAWNPTGEILTIINEEKGKLWMYYYTVKTKQKDKFQLFDIEKVLNFSYSQDGRLLAMSAVKDGQSDIYVHNRISHTNEQITNDIYDDLDPCFADHSQTILFCSNRPTDTITSDKTVMNIDLNDIPKTRDLFLYKYKERSKVLRRITTTPFANESSPVALDMNNITYLSDANGIVNRYIAHPDSTIHFIDTTTHYRYFTTTYPVTNYAYSILQQDISPRNNKIAEIILVKNKYELYIHTINKENLLNPLKINNTSYMNTIVSQYISPENTVESSAKAKEKLQKKQKKTAAANEHNQDNANKSKDNKTKIDINNYSLGNSNPPNVKKDNPTDTSIHVVKKFNSDLFKLPKLEDAEVEFSINKFVGQIDFNFLNYTYQPFTGFSSPSSTMQNIVTSPMNAFINSGLNLFLKFGVIDLFEDYRITGGVKLSPDLVNNEYVLSFSNVKKRLDKEIVFHRQSIDNNNGSSLVRNRLHGLYYILKWPFSPVLSVRGTASFKYERYINLATDMNSLKKTDYTKNWGGLKGELIYDDTREKGLNLYYGTRFKIFGEYYNQVDKRKQNMIVLGCDFRNYQKIHRTFIWANRLAASTSLGNNRLLYYMGGVDNWFLPAPRFSNDVGIAQDQHYAYQTLATNMRGFPQNIRNGNSFVVFNSELRFPIFKYFSSKPIKSNFLNNFQIVAFSDIGTAWTGDSPYSDKNSLYKQTIVSDPFKITIQNQKEPIVYGFGGGLRTRIMGYFVRADLAWGLDDGVINPAVFYLSLGLDF